MINKTNIAARPRRPLINLYSCLTYALSIFDLNIEEKATNNSIIDSVSVMTSSEYSVFIYKVTHAISSCSGYVGEAPWMFRRAGSPFAYHEVARMGISRCVTREIVFCKRHAWEENVEH